jgi:hypothetical protein
MMFERTKRRTTITIVMWMLYYSHIFFLSLLELDIFHQDSPKKDIFYQEKK